MDLTNCSAVDLAALIRSRKTSAMEVLDAHLLRIEKLNPVINAIVRLDADRARSRARDADTALARGENWGPLHGVPFTLKDMNEAPGIGASVGTRASEHIPNEDGVVAKRLKEAGAILLGKTNMAMALQTISEQFGRSSNPYDVSRTDPVDVHGISVPRGSDRPECAGPADRSAARRSAVARRTLDRSRGNRGEHRRRAAATRAREARGARSRNSLLTKRSG